VLALTLATGAKRAGASKWGQIELSLAWYRILGFCQPYFWGPLRGSCWDRYWRDCGEYLYRRDLKLAFKAGGRNCGGRWWGI